MKNILFVAVLLGFSFAQAEGDYSEFSELARFGRDVQSMATGWMRQGPYCGTGTGAAYENCIPCRDKVRAKSVGSGGMTDKLLNIRNTAEELQGQATDGDLNATAWGDAKEKVLEIKTNLQSLANLAGQIATTCAKAEALATSVTSDANSMKKSFQAKVTEVTKFITAKDRAMAAAAPAAAAPTDAAPEVEDNE